MLDSLVTFTEVLIKVGKAADEMYYEGKDEEFEAMVLSPEQILGSMNIDDINICYETSTVANFEIKNVEQTLRQHYQKNDFAIKDVIIRKNCAYIKIMHDIPLNGGNRCYGTAFSVNYIEPNNGVSIYGYYTKNSDERQAFKEIANELIKVFS
ncbi:hypothetical protein ACFFLS_10215 [Flavobacterium procerum]|uniref:Uncharacterized protein n=1 Tax=Flavobacterium procerum TaxID=1455569 RepID=A0ABV6BPP1_9FLAO